MRSFYLSAFASLALGLVCSAAPTSLLDLTDTFDLGDSSLISGDVDLRKRLIDVSLDADVVEDIDFNLLTLKASGTVTLESGLLKRAPALGANADVDIDLRETKTLDYILDGVVSAVDSIAEEVGESLFVRMPFCHLLLTRHLFSKPHHCQGYCRGREWHPRECQDDPHLRHRGHQGDPCQRCLEEYQWRHLGPQGGCQTCRRCAQGVYSFPCPLPLVLTQRFNQVVLTLLKTLLALVTVDVKAAVLTLLNEVVELLTTLVSTVLALVGITFSGLLKEVVALIPELVPFIRELGVKSLIAILGL